MVDPNDVSMGVKVMRENHVIKMAAFAAACCCLIAVATALLCAVNSVQPGTYMVRTIMAPLICVCSYLLNATGYIANINVIVLFRTTQ